MAIEQFGESLLTQKRQRDEEQEKKLRKREERNTLLGLAGTVGIGLYRKNLKEKQQNFLSSQPVMDMKIKYNQAQRIADDTEAERQRVMGFGGSYEDYYYNKAFEDVKGAYLERYANDSDRVAYITAGREDAAISKDARAVYQEQLDAQLAREKWADRFKAQGSFEDVLSMSTKRPTSAFDGFLNFLRGTSDQELDKRTIQAMRQSSLGRVALPASPEKQSEAERLEEAYRITNNIIDAQDVADLGKLRRDTRKEISLAGGYNSSTGLYDYKKIIKQFDNVTNKQLDLTVEVADSINLNSPEAIAKGTLKNLKTSFNPTAEAKRFLNERGQQEYLKIISGDPAMKTLESYNSAVAAFVALTTDEKNNYVIDPSKKFTAIQEAALKSEFYANRLAMISADLSSEDLTVRDKAQADYEILMAEIARLGVIEN